MNKSTPEEESLNSFVKDFEHIAKKTSKKAVSFFSWLGKAFKTLLINWKTLFILAFIGGILGASSLFVIPRKYKSTMVLRTHIDSKDQLFNDVNYLNTLIEKSNKAKISELFGISLKEAAEITSIKIRPFSSINERLNTINLTYGELDSNLRKNMDIEKLLQNDEFSFTNKFKLTIYAKDPFAFANIEPSLLLFLERVPQLNKLKDNKSAILQMQKKQYEKEIRSLDSLKSILNRVLIEQAKSNNNGMTINLGQAGQSESINPLRIYRQVEEYTQHIMEIEEELPLYEQCYFVVSHLNHTGHKTIYGGLLRAIIGAIILGTIGIFSIVIKSVKR